MRREGDRRGGGGRGAERRGWERGRAERERGGEGTGGMLEACGAWGSGGDTTQGEQGNRGTSTIHHATRASYILYTYFFMYCPSDGHIPYPSVAGGVIIVTFFDKVFPTSLLKSKK